MRSVKRRRDPAPSKTAFRARRMWRSRSFRRFATLWLPLAMFAGAGVWAWEQEALRARALTAWDEARSALMTRPEFAIRRMEITGATAPVEADLRAALAPLMGASSLAVDAKAVRTRAESLGWIASARVRLEAPETLRVQVRERRPAALWRHEGRLALVDRAGAVIDMVEARADRADLPLVSGRGADAAVGEALQLLAAAGPLGPRLRGLVRVGERRWNAVLNEGPVIMLPESGALDAWSYVVTLETTETVLSRDLTEIDLRLMSRPTLRLGPDARRSLEASRTAAEEEDA